MVFNSLTFLLFFVVVLALHYSPLSWRARKFNLLIASYVFYAAWNPLFVILLWISTVVDWFVARRMAEASGVARRRSLLLASLATNLGLLGFFKYGDFILENTVALLALVGIQYSPPPSNIVLPVGISFYTFQTLSYTLDIYHRHTRPCKSFLDFALYVSFFPQLVAGPIVRSTTFLPQCVEERRATPRQLGWGFALLTIGLSEKVVLADTFLAPIVDQVFGAAAQTGFVTAWFGTLAFSGQIFFDFAGYSTCAIGAGLCLGFALPDNFRFPYGAVGLSDFWRRWHISLSTWLRDYLYISLGGNRAGLARTQLNLMITMLLGGLWHGASWTFIIWGGLHGLYLLIERLATHYWGGHSWVKARSTQFALGVLTYLLVCIAWVFFRAQDFSTAFQLLRAMSGQGADVLALVPVDVPLAAATIVGLLAAHVMMRNSSLEAAWSRLPWWMQSGVLAGLLIVLFLTPDNNRAFIYFQF